MISYRFTGGVMECMRMNKMDDLSSSQRWLLVVLASYANKKGECWPSQKSLAEVTGLTRQTVNTCLKVLVEKKYITSRKRKDPAGDLTTNIYRLMVKPKLPEKQSDNVVPLRLRSTEEKLTDRSWAN